MATVPAARYSTVAIVLHWAIAALLIFEVGLGLRMEGAHGLPRFAVFQLHKSIGITILLLVAARLAWRLIRTPPAITATPWERRLATAVHWLFYLILFAMPISGWIIVSTSRIVVPTLLYGTIPWPHFPGLAGIGAAARAAWHDGAEFTHTRLVLVIYALFVAHLAGALKHHFIDDDGDIAKMAPGARPGRLDARLLAILAGVVIAAGLGRQWLPIGHHAAAAPSLAPAPVLPAPMPVPSETATPTPSATPSAAPTVAAGAPVPSWGIAKSSTLKFHTSWSGDGIDGGFGRFTGDIAFDPDRLAASHVEIRVDTASAYSGDAQRDETLKSDDWFAVGSFATATYRAAKFRKLAPDRYVANGTLRLKGVALPLALPFTLKIDGDKAAMTGTATIDRTAYKIGQGAYTATDEIPAAVRLDVMVEAVRK